MRSRLIQWLCICLCGLNACLATAQEFDERFEDWPIDLKINGRLVVTAERNDLKYLAELLPPEELQGECWQIGETPTALAKRVPERDLFSVVTACEFDRALRLPPERVPDFIAWHIELPSVASPSTVDTERIAEWLNKQMAVGKTVIVTGSAANMLGKYFPSHSPQATPERSGFDLLPDCVLEMNFASDLTQRSLENVKRYPRCVGLGLEPHTLLLLAGRQLRVAGTGRAWLMLPAGANLPARVESIAPHQRQGQTLKERLADLTEWRRDAIDRTLEPFPPAQPQPPNVAKGTLLIVGGGGMPPGLMQRFVDLAGGVDQARLVYIPCQEQETVEASASIMEKWRVMGVNHSTQLHTKDRQQAHSDEAFLAPLNAATGIWFGGGRQWNLADSYYGTRAHELMKKVLWRGGVIGGSSAGASIQARYLARATPIENFQIMAPGYERGGLGFLTGVAIDQHFSERGRHPDMKQLVNRYPQLLGIGIDEATALIVQGSQATITGRGAVYFYDRRSPAYPDAPDYLTLTDGQVFDLVERRVLVDSTVVPQQVP